MPDAAHGLSWWLIECMREAGTGWYIWERNEYGNLWRGSHRVASRAAVWTLMRRPMPGTREVLSYPVIAELCGLRSHSTVHEAVRRAGGGE